MTGDRLPADWLAGWRRLYPPMVFRGEGARALGALRMAAVLACVDERGRRRRPFPTLLSRAALRAAAHAAEVEEAAVRRAVLGVE